ncbi:hypothetical protein ETB97_010270 [Aspergillus alliaceus]|uniref:FAD/NAD(P)-binding domain-containing protein n=1 Tax=Petromyces alliaceus TaxID=209559 RepID=A0A8H5ZW67_PETAA|nr:hypothetical protein ETB97_010270 [Aspergillus burnettii]
MRACKVKHKYYHSNPQQPQRYCAYEAKDYGRSSDKHPKTYLEFHTVTGLAVIMDAANLPDYLTTPSDTFPSFHLRCGERNLPNQARKANSSGFPVPGVQSPTAASVMTKNYFVSDETWSNILDHGMFDYIVVGSGCTALAFIDETLRLDRNKRILVLERGDFWLPSHFQNLPLPFKLVLGGPSETFPWTLSRKTFQTKELVYCHGSCPFFGGRSTFWSAWCPQPPSDLMREFPRSMIETTTHPIFWELAEKLLHVTSASDIDDTIFANLQFAIDKNLQMNLDKIPSADSAESAKLAVGRGSPTSTLRFSKWSVPGPLLALVETQRKLAGNEEGAPLEVMLNCTVNKMNLDSDGTVRFVDTNRGLLSWVDDKTKIILCGGAIPNATLLLNSFERARKTVGRRLTGHFLTHIVARCPIKNVPGFNASDKLEIGASYLAGKDVKTKRQYHSQITAIYSPNPKNDADDAARECPDYAAAATYAQLKGSENHVVFVCATLGEFTENNEHNFVKLNDTQDPSCNVTLQFTLNDEDKSLWDTMDLATYQAIRSMTNGKSIEYWDEKAGKWSTRKPHVNTIRVNGVVHEASTAFVGDEKDGGSLDEWYRPYGANNVVSRPRET